MSIGANYSCQQKKKGLVVKTANNKKNVAEEDSTFDSKDDKNTNTEETDSQTDDTDGISSIDGEDLENGEVDQVEDKNASPKPNSTSEKSKTIPKTEPKGSNTPSTLASSLNITLGTSSSSVKLATVFTTKYLLIDFSQPGCGPCIAHAKQFNTSSSSQSRYGGRGSCKAITIVNPGALQSWHSAVGGASTPTGKSSFEFSLSQMTSLLNTGSIRSTPWFILIDRSGRVLGSTAGREPAKASELCR